MTQTADKRSDIWSFGVVLFEMLTGQQLFTGETVSHVLASVSRPSERQVSLRCYGRICGSLVVDIAALREAVDTAHPWLRLGRLSAVNNVIRKVEAASEELLSNYVSDRAFDPGDPFQKEVEFFLLEHMLDDWHEPSMWNFVDWVAASGSPVDRDRLARALRKQITGKAAGRPRHTVKVDDQWMAEWLPRVRHAVTEARSDWPTLESLNDVLADLLPNKKIPILREVVRRCRRPNQAVESIIGLKFGVGRDKAHDLILAWNKRRSRASGNPTESRRPSVR